MGFQPTVYNHASLCDQIGPAVRGVPESGLIRYLYFYKNKIVGQPSSLPRVTIFGS